VLALRLQLLAQVDSVGTVPRSSDLPRDIGGFIRDLRSNARISLRELAARAGVSNPYLSQVERGLRRPSAEVLSQLADALHVSKALMYLRAGLLPDKDGHSVLGAIAADPDLTVAQKQSLTQIYETFRRENARAAAAAHAPATGADSVDAAAPGVVTNGALSDGVLGNGALSDGAPSNGAGPAAAPATVRAHQAGGRSQRPRRETVSPRRGRANQGGEPE
jgi:transcriptional regulator with XRE-family HTH domain